MTMPEYQATIGKWITQSYEDAVIAMGSAEGNEQFFSAQGQFKAMSQLKDRISSIFVAEKAATIKQDRKQGINS